MFVAVVSAAVVVGVVACGVVWFWPIAPAQRFMLVADTPPPRQGGLLAHLLGDTEPVAHDDIRGVIRARLLSAYQDLAFAKSGKWSLATWAQLQWARNSLDGYGRDSAAAYRSADPRLHDFGFVRLVNEFVGSAPADQKLTAEAARHAAVAIVEELASATPNTRNPETRRDHVAEQIATDPRLKSFTSDFPPLGDIPLPPDDF